MNDQLTWLERTAGTVAGARPDSAISSAALALLGSQRVAASPALGVYLSCVTEHQAACRVGNFEFWSWPRLTSADQSPGEYGGEEHLLIIADWMLDSEFCAVDCYTDQMVFLGGAHPVRSTLRLGEFLCLVVHEPLIPHGML